MQNPKCKIIFLPNSGEFWEFREFWEYRETRNTVALPRLPTPKPFQILNFNLHPAKKNDNGKHLKHNPLSIFVCSD